MPKALCRTVVIGMILFGICGHLQHSIAQQAGTGAGDRNRPEQYCVKRGDTLMSIARKKEIFNDPALWPLIYKANRDQIRDPRIIYPGQVLTIPHDSTSQEMAEARKQAGIFASQPPAVSRPDMPKSVVPNGHRQPEQSHPGNDNHTKSEMQPHGNFKQ
ncbi:MAG: LysM peptidoglycan-binding domain-containing protein [Desulfobacterota bacterium]|nr:LysM peptidoglycan-binding domain-containing protein [Thermodesulfobacteriota bacterium]